MEAQRDTARSTGSPGSRRLSLTGRILGSAREEASETASEFKHLLTATNEAHDYYFIRPDNSVYSLLLFVPPVEQRRHGHYCTWLIVFCVWLVVLNFFIQFGLLYVVGHNVVAEHAEWIGGIVRLESPAWYHLHDSASMQHMVGGADLGECHDSGALCHQNDGVFSCAPPSVRLLSNWSTLDVNRDGIWSREEAYAQDYRDRILCKFHLDPSVLYDSTVNILQRLPGLVGRLHSNITNGTAIHKAYFDYYMVEPVICMYGDEDMCGNLLVNGYFDEAMRQRTFEPMRDLASAKHYCSHLLQHKCAEILPSTYRVWKVLRDRQCGLKQYHSEEYTSPKNDKDKWVLLVDYEKRVQYAGTQSWTFLIFVSILLFSFYATLALEMRSITKDFFWVWEFPANHASPTDYGSGAGIGEFSPAQFPHDVSGVDAEGGMGADMSVRRSRTDFPPGGAHPSHGGTTPRIHAIRRDHRYMVAVTTFLRLVLAALLLYVGTLFLTSDTQYLNLIFDALSLVFIIQIDELLYETMLRVQVKDDHARMAAMKITRRQHLRPIPIDFSICLLICIFAFLNIWQYGRNELEPVAQALECGCLAQGSKCFESEHFNKAWWDNHWTTTLPEANNLIARLVA